MRTGLAITVVAVLLGGAAPDAPADEGIGAGPRNIVADDLFVAGRSVDLTAEVRGDMFAAGGWVDVNATVADNLIVGGGLVDLAGSAAGDVITAGGVVDVVAEVGDNLVVTGVAVTVDGPVRGKLFASGGRLRVGRDAAISGDAWLAAGSGDVGGTIGGDLTVGGGNITLRGRIGGNVEVTALSLDIAPGAVIDGRVVFHGPDPPDVAEGARVAGGVEHRLEPEPQQAEPEQTGWPPFVWLLVVLALGLLLDLVLPSYVRAAGERFRSQPLLCCGLGIVVLLLTPVLILISIVSVLGIAIGLVAVAAYGALLLLGPVAAMFGFADLALDRLAPRMRTTPLRRRLAFVLALVVLGLVGWLPYVGAPLLWLVATIGLGAATWQLYASMRAGPAASPASG